LSQYINAGSKTFAINTKGGFTAIAYVAFTGSVGDWESVFVFGNGSFSDNLFLSRSDATSTVSVELYNGDSSVVTVSNQNAISQNVWAMYTVRYSASTRVLSVYKNGNLLASDTATEAITDKIGLSKCYIGKSNWEGDALFNGNIAGLYVYDRYLSDSEVASVTSYLRSGAPPGYKIIIH
jgi:hypothetical protein